MSMSQSPGRRFFDEPVELYLEGRNWAVRADQATLVDVLQRFSNGQEAVIVVDGDEQVVGILVPSDMNQIASKFQADPRQSVTDVMTPRPEVVFSGQPLGEALAVIQRLGLRTGIPVVDRNSSRYLGYLSRAGVNTRLEAIQKAM